MVVHLLLMMVRLLGYLTSSFAANTAEEATASKEDYAKDSSNDDANNGRRLTRAFRATHTVNSAAELALRHGHPRVNSWRSLLDRGTRVSDRRSLVVIAMIAVIAVVSGGRQLRQDAE